jgi:hypothetical protein
MPPPKSPLRKPMMNGARNIARFRLPEKSDIATGTSLLGVISITCPIRKGFEMPNPKATSSDDA